MDLRGLARRLPLAGAAVAGAVVGHGLAYALAVPESGRRLTKRKLMPALYNLGVSRSLPSGFAVVGVARREKSHEQFRAEMKEGVSQRD